LGQEVLFTSENRGEFENLGIWELMINDGKMKEMK